MAILSSSNWNPAVDPSAHTRRGGRRRRSWKRALGRRLAIYGGVLTLLLLVGWNTGCMERLFYYPTREATPAPATEFRNAEKVAFTSADGTRLVGWFIPAQAPRQPIEPTNAPTILHVHGNAGNINHHLYFTEYLPRAGFNVVLFDYRGYGESEGKPRKRNDLIADTRAALDMVLARDDIDPKRVGIYGQSLGGAIALNLMAERPEVRAAVVESPFTCWREVAASALGGAEPGFISRTLTAMLIPCHARPIDSLREIDRPILLMHGTDDRTIPVEHSRRLQAAAREAGAPLHYLELEGGDHNQLRDTHPEIEPLVITFLRTHLAPRE